MNYQATVATYTTEKTETTDIVIVGHNGIISIKVVYTGRGHKTNVYSGYDVSNWTWHGEAGRDVTSEAWEHAYYTAQVKAVTKYDGKLTALVPGDLLSIIDQLPMDVQSAIRVAVSSHEKVNDHLRMLEGTIPGVSTMRGAKKEPVAPKPAPIARSQDEINRERMEVDEMYGIF